MKTFGGHYSLNNYLRNVRCSNYGATTKYITYAGLDTSIASTTYSVWDLFVLDSIQQSPQISSFFRFVFHASQEWRASI